MSLSWLNGTPPVNSWSHQNTHHVKVTVAHMKKIRAHAIIKGIVQGVCFRAYTQQEARRLEVAGWVKNLYDGSVEAVFEGDRTAVEAVITWVSFRPPTCSGGKREGSPGKTIRENSTVFSIDY